MADLDLKQWTMSEEDIEESIGVSGLNRQGGYIHEEWNDRLKGIRAARAYREMRDVDAVIGAFMYLTESLCMTATWDIEPSDNEDETSKYWAEFVEQCMEDMTHTWVEFISEVLTMCTFGYAPFEQCFKRRNGKNSERPDLSSRFDDNRIGWSKIEIRAQETIEEWCFDEYGNLLGYYQVAAPQYKRVFVPISKSILFRTRSNKNNPEGRSFLRNAFRSYYFLKRIQEHEATGIERDLTGIPVAYLPHEYMSNNASSAQTTVYNYCKRAVQQIRSNQRAGLVMPAKETKDGVTGFGFEMMASPGRRQHDTNAIVTRYESRIAMVLLAQFLLLGQSGTGSFALSSDQTNTFSLALGALLDLIAEQFNRQAIPLLMEANGVPEEYWPYLKHGDVESVNVQEFAEALNKLVGAGVLTPDDKLEERVREELSLPDADPTSRQGVTEELPQMPNLATVDIE